VKLTASQHRALKYAASGGTFTGLRPGSNRDADVEYQYSERGVGIFCDGDDVAQLFASGLLTADELETPIEVDDYIVTHRLSISPAGHAALSATQGSTQTEKQRGEP